MSDFFHTNMMGATGCDLAQNEVATGRTRVRLPLHMIGATGRDLVKNRGRAGRAHSSLGRRHNYGLCPYARVIVHIGL